MPIWEDRNPDENNTNGFHSMCIIRLIINWHLRILKYDRGEIYLLCTNLGVNTQEQQMLAVPRATSSWHLANIPLMFEPLVGIW